MSLSCLHEHHLARKANKLTNNFNRLPSYNQYHVWNAWVDYNGATNLLEVRWSQTTGRPLAAQLSSTIDLIDTLGQDTAYLGFTSGTGLAWGTHEILSWEYRDSFSPITTVPEPDSYAMILLGLFGITSLRRIAILERIN